MANSARVTATGQAVAGPCEIITVRLCAAAGKAASLSVYNGTAAVAANEVVLLRAAAGEDAESELNVFLPGGAWVVLAGADARAFVNTI